MSQKHMKLIAIIAFFLATIIACYYAFKDPMDSIRRTFAIGALASLIASLFYGLLMFVLVRESTEDKKQFLACLNEIEKRKLKGIHHIRAKSEFAPEFWISLSGSEDQETEAHWRAVGHGGQARRTRRDAPGRRVAPRARGR